MQKYRYIQIEQIEVRITELIKYILNKYSLILIFAIVCACGIPAVKYYIDSNQSVNTNEDNEEYKYESMKLNLYEEQLDENYKQYQTILKYKEDAYIMQLDYNNIYTLTIQFIVNASEENITDIMTAYSNYYTNGNIAKAMCNLDGTIKQRYLVELIRFGCSNYTNFETSSVMNVKLYGKNEEFCKKYSKIIKEVFKEFSKELDAAGKSNELVILSESIVKAPVAEIKSIQDSNNVALSHLEANIANLKIKIDTINNSDIIKNNEGHDASLDFKFIILGFVLGAFFALLVLSIVYIFSNKVKYAEEISEYSDLILLGKINFSRKKVIDKIDKRDNVLQKEIILNKIRMLYNVKNEGISVIYASDDKNIRELGRYFETNEPSDFIINIVGDIVSDSKSMKMFTDCPKNIVLAISKMNTRYEEINSLIEICNIKETDILGYIYVE